MSRARRAAMAALVALTCAQLAAPAIDQAQAEPNTGSGSGSGVSCPEFGGGSPGDEKTLTTTKTVNGKKVTTKYTVICGSDGKWHQEARIVVNPGQVKGSQPSTTLKGV
jgi:hypothetical protein